MNTAVDIINVLANYAYFVLALLAVALLMLCIASGLCFSLRSELRKAGLSFILMFRRL